MKRLYLAASLALTLVACSSSQKVITTPSIVAATPHGTATTRTDNRHAAHVGATIVLAGTTAPTLMKIIDPAHGATFTARLGNRFVAIDLKIADVGTSAIAGNVDITTSAQGSDLQTYTPDFDAVKGCKNFSDGGYTIFPGRASVGCVVVQVPIGIAIKAVEFTSAGFGSQTAQWQVP